MRLGLKKTLLVLFLSLGLAPFVLAEATGANKNQRRSGSIDKSLSSGKVTLAPVSFRVKKVTFKEVVGNGSKYLAAAVEFNQKVKADSIAKGVNHRVLRFDNGSWVDAYPSGNTNIRVLGKFITWASTVPISPGEYKVHLRGTIKNTNGDFLDCDKDGKGEGGYLPPYESAVYTISGRIIEGIDTDLTDRIRQLR